MADSDVRSGLLKHIANLEEEYPLNSFNPFGAGGVADFFTITEDTVELAAAVKAAIDNKIPYLVIGQSEKVLFSDGGFPGLVIQNKAQAFAMAAEHSQVVVDAGLPLDRCISLAAGNNLGGLTYLYGEPGTIGGAIYANLTRGNRSILSSVRFLTVLMPPARLDKEATINRYKADWLTGKDGQTMLRATKDTKPIGYAHPVILTVVLQLTSLRQDELRLQIQEAAERPALIRPQGVYFGPVFNLMPDGTDLNVLLRSAKITHLRVGQVFPDRRMPNFIRSKGKVVRSAELRELIDLMAQAVEVTHGIQLSPRYEYLGVW